MDIAGYPSTTASQHSASCRACWVAWRTRFARQGHRGRPGRLLSNSLSSVTDTPLLVGSTANICLVSQDFLISHTWREPWKQTRTRCIVLFNLS
jgi:hypothetical protein